MKCEQGVDPRREDHERSMPNNASRGPHHCEEGPQRHWQSKSFTHPSKNRDERKQFDPRQRHWQSRFTKEASQAMVASPELLALLACLSATFPIYCRLESSRLLRMDAQIICPTGPRSLEWETRRRATGGPKSNCSSRAPPSCSTRSCL